MAIEIVDFPIKHGDFNHSYVSVVEGSYEGLMTYSVQIVTPRYSELFPSSRSLA